MLRSLGQGIEVCLTLTLLDGLVLARSAFHHSMNYRSVVIFGTATVLTALLKKNGTTGIYQLRGARSMGGCPIAFAARTEWNFGTCFAFAASFGEDAIGCAYR